MVPNVTLQHLYTKSSNWRHARPFCSFFRIGGCAAYRQTVHAVYRMIQCHEFSNNRAGNAEDSMQRLKRQKKIFAICLFSATFLTAWYLQQKKALKLKKILQDCQRIPVEEGLFEAKVSLYRCKGCVFPGQIVMSGILQELPHFQFRPEDIVVASFPKAGTTWVQEIIYMLTHDVKKTHRASEVLETRFPYLEYPYPGIREVAARLGQRLIKTHLPIHLLPPSFHDVQPKLVYIARNPRDTAVSYFHFMKLLMTASFAGTFQDFVQLFLSDSVPYSPFREHVKGYLNSREDSKILFIMYEELQKNPVEVIRKIAEFLEIYVTDYELQVVAEATSFSAMQRNPSVNYEHWKDLGFAHKDQGSFLRKGVVGDWQNYFSKEILDQFSSWENKNSLPVKFTFTEKGNSE